MLSGRGIDGELKSKFGELTEKFWQSSSGESPIQAKNFRAIYLTNGEGNSGGEALRKLSNDGRLIVGAKGDSVSRFFGICINGRNGDGCKEKNNNVSIVLVSSDNLDNAMTWEKLKEQNWNQTSLVRSGHSYKGLFGGRFWSGVRKLTGYKFNELVLQQFLKSHKGNSEMKKILCPWASTWNDSRYALLRSLCGGLFQEDRKGKKTGLVEFLNDPAAKNYFDQRNWASYGRGWQGVAFLSLMKLWSADLTHVNYGGSSAIFDHKSDSFSLSSLIKSSQDVIFASLDPGHQKITSIDKYSSNKWTVLLEGRNGSHETNQSLSVTLSEGELCIRELICLMDSELNRQKSKITSSLRTIDQSYFGSLWTLIFNIGSRKWDYKVAFMALLAAAFNSPEDVVVSVQKPAGRGEMIFTRLSNEK